MPCVNTDRSALTHPGSRRTGRCLGLASFLQAFAYMRSWCMVLSWFFQGKRSSPFKGGVLMLGSLRAWWSSRAHPLPRPRSSLLPHRLLLEQLEYRVVPSGFGPVQQAFVDLNADVAALAPQLASNKA